jgi:hypothetical protein
VWAAVAVAAVGVTAGIVWVAVETRTAEPPVSLNGPLQQVPAHGWIAVVRPGATITDAQEILYNGGDAPVTSTDIEVVGGSKSLLYLGALVAGPDRARALSQQFPEYPPTAHAVRGFTRPAIGAVLEPTTTSRLPGYELLIGYRFIADEFDARSEVRISYTSSGRDYRLDLPARLITCPTSMTEDACFGRADKLFPDG